jgi:hypothetical protein
MPNVDLGNYFIDSLIATRSQTFTIGTTPQVLTTGYYKNIDSLFYDIATYYKLRSDINLSPPLNTGLNVKYNDNYYDISAFLDVTNDLVSLGIPSMTTWNISISFLNYLSTSNWIWNYSNARTYAPKNINISFTFTYISNAATTTIGTFYASVVGSGYLYFNRAAPTYIGTDTISGMSGSILSENTVTPVTGYMTLVPGSNYIRIICYNSGNSAGLIASFYNSTTIFDSTTLIAKTDNAWTSTLVPVANTTNSLSTVVKGGLNTTFLINNSGYVWNGANGNNSIGVPHYYYNNLNSSGFVSNKIINNFSIMSNIIDPYPSGSYWGFFSSGFFVPTIPDSTATSASWTFTMSAAAVAQFWISTGINTTNNPTAPSSTHTIENLQQARTNNSVTLTLTIGQYYPILIYYGVGVVTPVFSLTVTSGSYTATHSDVFYYVNYYINAL